MPPFLFMLALALTAMTSRPRGALDAILAAFAYHRVVLLGEIHGSVAQHRFIQRLLRDPRLPAAASDIAVEFANSRYQPLIDRYVSGEDVPADSLSLAWRNAIVPLAWDAAVYLAFFRTVREVNRKLPTARRLRVVALDPPIAWDSVHAADDIPRRWGYRDPVWFDVLEREVFARGRKALVIAGGLHVIRRDPVTSFEPAALDRAGLGDALAQRYPGAVYVTYPVVGSGTLARGMGRPAAGTLVEVRGTPRGEAHGGAGPRIPRRDLVSARREADVAGGASQAITMALTREHPCRLLRRTCGPAATRMSRTSGAGAGWSRANFSPGSPSRPVARGSTSAAAPVPSPASS